MKKQILFIAFLVLATFANTMVFGQGAVKYSDPIPLVCVNDALHPIAGKKYTYEATGVGLGTGTFQFWATKDQNFITSTGTAPSLVTTLNTASALTVASGDLILASGNYNTAAAAGTVDITWSSKLLNLTKYQGTGTLPTFVAAYYKDGGTGCSDNFKVWEINPKNGFTVDVKPMDPAALATKLAYGATPAQCPDVVRTATYAPATGIHYDYGVNYLYFEFVASNFSDYWVPTFDFNTSLKTSQTTTIEYTFDLPATWSATTVWKTLVSGTTHLPVDATVTNTELGVSTFVRVTLANQQWENLAGQTLAMILDGQNADAVWDVDNSDCAKPLVPGADQNDKAEQLIKIRPTITPVTTSTTAPTTIVTGDNK